MRSPQPSGRRAAVIGGGVIGLAAARRLAGSGWKVTLLERGVPGQEASSAAAGMIAPRLEFAPGSTLLEMAVRSSGLYPSFVEELEAETGKSVDLRLEGILMPLLSGEKGDEPPTGARLVRGGDLRGLEPSLAPGIQEAWLYPGEGSVDSRALVAALHASALARGVQVIDHAAADDVVVEGGRVAGVRAGGVSVDAEVVINCAGAWASAVRVPSAKVDVRPIKGQMGLLAGGDGPRLAIYSSEVYIVPRSDGRNIIGTTVEDRGFDKEVVPAAVERLVAAARRLCPGLAEAKLADSWAGLRPRSASGEAPSIGRLGPRGYLVAVGHYRNGILLAPLTAEILEAEARAAAGD